MEKTVKVVVLVNDVILLSQIEEVGADIGEPDCKLINPFVVKNNQISEKQKVLEPFLLVITFYLQEKVHLVLLKN